MKAIEVPVLPGDLIYDVIPPEDDEPTLIYCGMVEDISAKQIQILGGWLSRDLIGKELFLTLEEAEKFCKDREWEYEILP